MAQSTAKRAGITLDKSAASHRRASSRANSRARNRAGRKKATHLPFAFKIGLAMSLISVSGAMVLVYLAVNQHWKLAQQQADAFGQTIAEQLATSMVEPVFTDDHLAIQLNLNQLASKAVVNAVAIYHVNGTQLAASGTTSGTALVPGDAGLGAAGRADRDISASLTGIASSYFLDELKQLPAGFYSAPIIFSGATAGYAVVSIDRTPFSAAFATSSQDLILAVVVISLVSILGAYLLSRLISKPIYRLLAVSDAARKGQLHSLPSMAKESGMRDEWADIFSIYEQLGHEVKNKREIEKLLQQFVATDVADQLLDQDNQRQIDGESVEASVLFVDIVNFTSMAEPMAPQDVASMLNRYLSIFASCARAFTRVWSINLLAMRL